MDDEYEVCTCTGCGQNRAREKNDPLDSKNPFVCVSCRSTATSVGPLIVVGGMVFKVGDDPLWAMPELPESGSAAG